MSDPYETLGVRRDAGPEALKAAHRRAARATHPDAGGDAASFDAVQKTYALLSCPERRARYDQTGQADGGGPDNSRGKLFEYLLATITGALQPLVEQGADPAVVDVLAAMRRFLAGRRQQITGLLGQIDRAKAALDTVRSRLTPTGDAAGEDLLAAGCQVQAGHLERQRQGLLEEADLIGQAEAVLKQYQYHVDRLAPRAIKVWGWTVHDFNSMLGEAEGW